MINVMKESCMLEFRAGCLALALTVVGGLAQPAGAQTYPAQNITFQVAFAAGGIADVVARLVGQKLSDRLGRTVVVENRGGTGPHIGAEYFFREVAKVPAVHVPFTGGAPAVQSAIGNHVDAIVLTLPTVVPPLTQGLLRGIGLASATRNSAVPNVPTYGEMGFPDVYSGSWVGFFAPAKTPKAIVTLLNRRINDIVQEPEAQQKLKTLGFDVVIKTESEAT